MYVTKEKEALKLDNSEQTTTNLINRNNNLFVLVCRKNMVEERERIERPNLRVIVLKSSRITS